MFCCNLASGAGVLTIVLLVRAGVLQVWHVYLVVGLSSIFNSFQWPAYIAATTQMVPKAQLGRANGLMQFGQASAEVLAPTLAGLLIAAVGMAGIVLIDFATFLFAAVTLVDHPRFRLVRGDVRDFQAVRRERLGHGRTQTARTMAGRQRLRLLCSRSSERSPRPGPWGPAHCRRTPSRPRRVT